MASENATRLLWGAVLALALAVAGVVIYKLAQSYLYPQAVIVAPLDSSCDLHSGPCAAELPGGGRVTLSITPRPVHAMEPLQVDVSVAGIELDDVEVDFAGVDMNMGYNRIRLEGRDERAFRGKAVLPVCVRDRMLWEATVMAVSDRGRISAPFRFVTSARR